MPCCSASSVRRTIAHRQPRRDVRTVDSMARLLPVVLALRYGRRMRTRTRGNQALEGDPPSRSATATTLRTWRSHLPTTSAPGFAALDAMAAGFECAQSVERGRYGLVIGAFVMLVKTACDSAFPRSDTRVLVSSGRRLAKARLHLARSSGFFDELTSA
jgi:hypothetical protein